MLRTSLRIVGNIAINVGNASFLSSNAQDFIEDKLNTEET